MRGSNMSKKTRKILANIAFAFTIILLVLLILVQLLPTKVVMSTIGFKPFVVITNSMQEEVDVLDGVFVAVSKIEDLEQGDIISFYADINGDGTKDVVTHYVAEIVTEDSEEIIHTKSNVSERYDTWDVKEEDLIGKMVFKIPMYGYFVIGMKDTRVFFGLIINILLSYGIYRVLKSDRPNEQEVTK